MSQSDERATLAIGEPATRFDPPTVIVGIPDTAWLNLANGGTMTFDLSHAGIRAQLIIFRGADGADIAELLGKAQSALDAAPHVGIKDPTRQ